MVPVRKPAGYIRLGAVGAYNSRGGGVQGSRVQRRGPGRPRRLGVRKPEPEPEPVVDAEPVAAGSPSSFPESEYESNSRSYCESVQLAATPSGFDSGSDEVAALTPAQIERQATHNASLTSMFGGRSGLLVLLRALQFAPNMKSPTRDEKKHTADFFHGIDFGPDAAGKDCLLDTQVDGALSAPIRGTGVNSAAEADRVSRILNEAFNEMDGLISGEL
ncbi:hypothetical protein CDV31_016269 [Fusarium ambrosium]|uniref:Uncharacterized protein n=1 Tax=Fusarium ambrosium TaxID=131363 RepID=A0A428SC86_9HYPO|nr:hypothetical protein CDV31_016269 [Fusarium ambrosium]